MVRLIALFNKHCFSPLSQLVYRDTLKTCLVMNCRLEYSEQMMAYKLYGISKPNTFVSSFVKKAEGGKGSRDDRGQKDRGQTQRTQMSPSNDMEEKWYPNSRGFYTLCFKNDPNYGLNTEEVGWSVYVTLTI